jgi:muramoyltetrapeptide carboxypeptidase
MALRKPRALRPGDVVRIVSPASPVAQEKIEAAVGILKGQGYEVQLGEHVFDAEHYLAGSDVERASDLMAAFEDPAVACVLCSRGGYGCARLLSHLDFDSLAASGKLFVGFSDVTTLHLALQRRGLVSLHGPMALSFSVDRPAWVIRSFTSALKGEGVIPPDAPRGECVVPGVAEGPVSGGCLCLLTDSIGTREAIQPDGVVLLIEDVDEPPHRVDAMLTQLLNSGIAERAAGFVVGEMTRTDEKADAGIGTRPWREIVAERLAPLGKPTILGFPFGHASGMLTLPLGVRARLDAERGELEYLEGHCQ